jgi:hypothetical protein
LWNLGEPVKNFSKKLDKQDRLNRLWKNADIHHSERSLPAAGRRRISLQSKSQRPERFFSAKNTPQNDKKILFRSLFRLSEFRPQKKTRYGKRDRLEACPTYASFSTIALNSAVMP